MRQLGRTFLAGFTILRQCKQLLVVCFTAARSSSEIDPPLMMRLSLLSRRSNSIRLFKQHRFCPIRIVCFRPFFAKFLNQTNGLGRKKASTIRQATKYSNYRAHRQSCFGTDNETMDRRSSRSEISSVRDNVRSSPTVLAFLPAARHPFAQLVLVRWACASSPCAKTRSLARSETLDSNGQRLLAKSAR